MPEKEIDIASEVFTDKLVAESIEDLKKVVRTKEWFPIAIVGIIATAAICGYCAASK